MARIVNISIVISRSSFSQGNKQLVMLDASGMTLIDLYKVMGWMSYNVYKGVGQLEVI